MKVIEYIKSYLMDINKSYDKEKETIYKLLSSMYNIDMLEFIAKYSRENILEEEKGKLKSLLDKHYVYNIPIPYITGKVNFFYESYIVNENVLIPRPDTENLVIKAIEYIKNENIASVLDMCCGSGAIRNIYC